MLVNFRFFGILIYWYRLAYHKMTFTLPFSKVKFLVGYILYIAGKEKKQKTFDRNDLYWLTVLKKKINVNIFDTLSVTYVTDLSSKRIIKKKIRK